MAKKPISKGIRVLKSKGKFEARVEYKGSSKSAIKHSMYVGEYNTLADAENARKDFIISLF